MTLLLSSFLALLGGMSKVEAQEDVVASSDVSAASGSNRFVVWQDTTGTGPGDIFFKRSTDNGATWKASVNLSNNPGGSYAPRIAVSGANVFVVWSQNSADSTTHDILLKRSTNNGVSWSGNIKITPGGTCTSSDGACHALNTFVASGSNIYLVTEKSGDIFLRRSADSSATWKSPVNLSSNAGRSYDPNVVVSGSDIYVTWTQESADHTSSDIFIRRSTDSGATWRSKVNLSSDADFSYRQNIAASGTGVYVAWEGEVSVDGRLFPGIKLKHSVDGGATWSSAQELSQPPTGEYSGASDPEIAATGSTVYVAWKDNIIHEDESSADIFLRRSLNAGDSWDSAVSIGRVGTEDNPFGCLPVRLAASGSNVYVITFGACRQHGDSIIFFSHSMDSGASWSPITLSRGIHSPQIAITGSTVFIVGPVRMSGPGYDIFITRSTDGGQNWEVAVNLSKLSGDSTAPQIAL